MRSVEAEFSEKLAATAKQVEDYIESHQLTQVSHKDMADSAAYYTKLGGKRLRPFAVIESCGAAGGDPTKVVPLAAAIELYHTWTLVHDDIIDEDEKRRFGQTVHSKWAEIARTTYGFEPHRAHQYGLTVGILTGDLQKGWSIGGLMPQLHHESGIRSDLVLKLIEGLDYEVLQTLVDGEILDVFYSRKPLQSITDEEVLDMLWKKTGVLYRFCGMSGAMVGLDTTNENDRIVRALSGFTSQCGLAFQIQDDILGLVGKESDLGKPVGSDVKQGKRTLAVLEAYRNATSEQRKTFNALGNQNANDEEVSKFVDVVRELKGIEYAQGIAHKYLKGGVVNGKRVTGALELLDAIKPSDHRDLLRSWANFLVNREF